MHAEQEDLLVRDLVSWDSEGLRLDKELSQQNLEFVLEGGSERFLFFGLRAS